jgi:hypothetical protein
MAVIAGNLYEQERRAFVLPNEVYTLLHGHLSHGNTLDLSLNDIGGTLGNSVDRALQVATHLEGHNGSIYNANVGGSVDLKGSVNNTANLFWHHSSSADWVEV